MCHGLWVCFVDVVMTLTSIICGFVACWLFFSWNDIALVVCIRLWWLMSCLWHFLAKLIDTFVCNGNILLANCWFDLTICWMCLVKLFDDCWMTLLSVLLDILDILLNWTGLLLMKYFCDMQICPLRYKIDRYENKIDGSCWKKDNKSIFGLWCMLIM